MDNTENNNLSINGKEIDEKQLDILKLESVLDNLMYVDRSNALIVMPENSEDVKPFLLSNIKKYLESVIKTVVQEDPERAKYYDLSEGEIEMNNGFIHS